MLGRVRTRVGPAGQCPPIQRASPDDLMELACDIGPAPMQVGAILLLDAGPGFDGTAARAVLADRLARIPRFRQRLARVPAGCGRPVWVDDPSFDISRHVTSVACRPPGDEAALLDTAAAIATSALPLSGPPWSATLVTGLAGAHAAVVVVFHHVLADGIGGLAALASLVDGAPSPEPVPFPRPVPSRSQLAADALDDRRQAFLALVAGLRNARAALAGLSPSATGRVPKTSLNRPGGPGRRLAVARADLGRIHELAHGNGATVNDLVLAAIARALRSFLAHRGESLDNLVVSVPVSGRAAAAATELGNRVGVMPVRVPATGSRLTQLHQIAAGTRARKAASRGGSPVLIRPVFRLLAALGVLRWLLNRQRLIQVFVTNIRGPAEPQRLAGAAITEILPVTAISGNVTVSFAVASYAGTLVVVTVADRALHPDLDILAALLQAELDVFAGPPARRPAAASAAGAARAR